MPDQFEQYYKYLKANGADVAPDFNSFKNTLSDYNNASKYYSYLKENQFDVPANYESFADTFGLKKKAENLQSSVIPSRLSKEPDFLQQGQKLATGEIFTDISKSVPKSAAQPVVKTTLKDAALKDKENNNSYLGAQWNNVVASAQRLAGGAAWLAQKFDSSPVSRIQEAVDKAASSVTGINYEAQREKEARDKITNFIGKARSNSSSKEYEQGLAEGFDVTNGIGLDDIKGLGAILPSMLVDIGAASATGGASFGIQGYDDALSMIDSTPEGKYMSETTRTAFGFGGAIISSVLEKLGMDGILKSGKATKYVTAKILKEAAGELAKKGVKVTAEQFEKTIANKATQMLTKTALKNAGKAFVKAGSGEAFTEATQEGANDLMKLAANKIEKKEIFDEEELKNTAASRYLNAAAMGGIFGGGLGSLTSRTKNVQQHIENEVKNAKTQEDINNILNDINQNLEDGVISENDAELFKSIVDENINKPSSLEINNEKETKISDIDEYINSLDKNDRLYNDKLSELNKEKNEIISFYDNISNKTKENEEVPFDDGKDIPSELIVDVESVIPEEIESKKAEIESRREAELNELPNRGVSSKGGVIITSKEFDEIKNKYDAELAELEIGNLNPRIREDDVAQEVPESISNVEGNDFLNDLKNISNSLGKPKIGKIQFNVTEEVKPTEVKSVEQLREQEQSELDSRITNAEQYRVDGKVDRAKLTNEEDTRAFDEVYNKYDKLISPLLEKPAEAKEEKTFAQKDLDRAEAKKIHGRVSEMEPPSDAEQVALRYLAEGGKVSQDAINEVSGTTKRASLNTGRRELKTEEAKARDYASGKESLDDLAHRLWENSGQEISERDIKDALMSEIGNNNTRLDASKTYLERYNTEYQEEQYYERFIEEEKDKHAKVQEELEKDLRKPLEEETEGMSSEAHIDNLIKQYEAETKRENKQVGTEGKGEAVEEISSRDTGKKAPEEAELAKDYREAISKASKKAKENAKKDFVDRNFDNLVKKLKIQIKCPT